MLAMRPLQERQRRIKTAWTRFLTWLLRGELPVYREIGVRQRHGLPGGTHGA